MSKKSYLNSSSFLTVDIFIVFDSLIEGGIYTNKKYINIVLASVSFILGLFIGLKYMVSIMTGDELLISTIPAVIIFLVLFWIFLSISKICDEKEAVKASIFLACVFVSGIIASVGYMAYLTGGLGVIFGIILFASIGTFLGVLGGMIILIIISGPIKEFFIEAS